MRNFGRALVSVGTLLLVACMEHHGEAGDAGYERIPCGDPRCPVTGSCCYEPDGDGYCCSVSRWDPDSGAGYCLDGPACEGRDALWWCCGEIGERVFGSACVTSEQQDVCFDIELHCESPVGDACENRIQYWEMELMRDDAGALKLIQSAL